MTERGANPEWTSSSGPTRIHEMSCAHLRNLLAWITKRDDGNWGGRGDASEIYDAEEAHFEAPVGRREIDALRELEARHARWDHLRGVIKPAIEAEVLWRAENNYVVLEAL